MSAPPAITADDSREANLVADWADNAAAWTAAVRARGIESRRLATDAAIIDKLLATAPRRVIDLGCGEGWLARRLSRRGVTVIGYDAIAELVAAARSAGGGEFHVLSYDELAAASPPPADAVVCNFSLFGVSSVEAVFRAIPAMLEPGGRFIVQTLPPAGSAVDAAGGWQTGSWDGIGPGFSAPPTWYSRSLDAWMTLYRSHRLRLVEQCPVCHPVSGEPLSLILVAVVAGNPETASEKPS